MSCGGMFGTDAVVLPRLCAPWGRVTDTPGVMFEGGGTLSVSNHRPWTFHSDGSDRLPFQNRKLSLPSLLAYSVLPNKARNCAGVSIATQIVRDSGEDM